MTLITCELLIEVVTQGNLKKHDKWHLYVIIMSRFILPQIQSFMRWSNILR